MGNECREIDPNLSHGCTTAQVVGWLTGAIWPIVVVQDVWGLLMYHGKYSTVLQWLLKFPEHLFPELTSQVLITIHSPWLSNPDWIPDLYIQQP